MTSLELERISRDPGGINLICVVVVVVLLVVFIVLVVLLVFIVVVLLLFYLTGFRKEIETLFGISTNTTTTGVTARKGSHENCCNRRQ
jgi:Na+/H+-dicarboxylate symporter